MGSNLAKELERLGHKVTIVDNFSTGCYENLQGMHAKVFVNDITTDDLVFGDKFDFIFHQAAITDPRYEKTEEIISKNIDGMKNVIKLAKKHKATLIYASSASVYGNGKSPMKENQELQPLCEYATSKIMCEKLALKNTSLKTIGLRYFNVYGPGEQNKGRAASMIYHIIKQCHLGKTIKLFKYGQQIRDQVYVKDVVNANILAMNENVKTGVYNVGSNMGTTFSQISYKILKFFKDKEIRTEFIDNPYDNYQENTVADLTHSKEGLGYEPHYNFSDGVEDYMETIEWKELQ